ncbi:hypothetical protein JHN63_50525 [Streptomyces sp. MBT65]|uniref:hypothetical protein n=1 Tax=Streptomyces sp. MBT65 TaxID=1488395 RepID=UPI00190CE305|nr:hypothetical protein [Streptomyces sp. MBT65]MBK3581846.1 hypothetical protein [Streptomyces sp. MBT65]
MKAWDDDATMAVLARLTGVYRPGRDDDRRGCGEHRCGDCGVAKTGRGNRDAHPGRGRGLPAWMERARMAMLTVAAVTVVAALVRASG